MRICSVEGCKNKYRCSGYCQNHYNKFRRYGDPLIVRYERHGMRNILEYGIWLDMIQRCYNPQNKDYCYYGGRGIAVCDRWNIKDNIKQSLINFIEDMGSKKFNFELDRVDNDKGYYKENCRWVSRTIQIRNRRNTILNQELAIKIRKLFDENYTRKEISKMLNLKYHNINNVLRKNKDGTWWVWKLIKKEN